MKITDIRTVTGHNNAPVVMVDVLLDGAILPVSIPAADLLTQSHYTPSLVELNRRSYKGLHVRGHACPHCGVDLIVNEREDKTTGNPFYTRRLVCPCFFTKGCNYKEPFTEAVMIELFQQAARLESEPAEF